MKKVILIVFILLLTSIIIAILSIQDSVLDINIYDTYFVVNKFEIILLVIGFSLFLFYLLKVLINNFKKNFDNKVFVFLNVVMIFFTIEIHSVFTTLTNSLTNLESSHSLSTENGFGLLLKVIVVFLLFLVLLGFYVSYRIGKNKNTN